MLYESGKYGVDFSRRQRRNDPSPLGPVLVLVGVLVLIFLVVFGAGRLWRLRERIVAKPPPEVEVVDVPPAPPAEVLPACDVATEAASDRRPREVRNLLLRLKEAMRKKDLPMAVSTIEKIRSLPGAPAADLDDDLARQLGSLNFRWMIVGRNPQWVETVVVKTGDSVSRISKERGASLASTLRLNPDIDPSRIRPGQSVSVLSHPHFRLTLNKSARLADLYLNDRFFKRYDLVGETTLPAGVYETAGSVRKFLTEKGVDMKADDRAELEMLLPSSVPVLVTDR